MPRRARIVVPGISHHITQRGNNRQPVFDTDFDRQIFLNLLGGYASRHGLAILGYCLMTNHFHLLAVPEEPHSIAHTIRRAESDYARYLNVRRGASGHLWQARYYSAPIDDQFRWNVLAYIERNPVRAKTVPKPQDFPWDFPWSSAAARLGLAKPPPWLQLDDWTRQWTPADWMQFLTARDDTPFAKQLRDATMCGFPVGPSLTRRLEQALNIRLHSSTAGRPVKKATPPPHSIQASLF